MLQYKVPQNVGIEDRIVGPLTLRQLIILAAGGGASYLLFAIASKLYTLNIFEYAVIALPALVSILAALVKINDITFTKFVFLFLEFNIKPRKRFWDHRATAFLAEPDLTESKIAPSQLNTKKQDQPSVDLETLSRVLDSRGFQTTESANHKDIDEVQDKYLLAQAFFGTKKDTATDNMYWRCKGTHEARLVALAKQPPLRDTQKKEETPLPPKQAVTPSTQSQAIAAPEKKEKKAFKGPVPIRKNNQINTLHKNKPLKYTPPAVAQASVAATATGTAPAPQEPPSPPEARSSSSLGEISFEELKKGEIEINLD
ncbi:PrgI family protein [Candidatus Peregrinibacteria bacterium]|nr:PrgI family protein [Candidatus Peregrinibacteria bacterium]